MKDSKFKTINDSDETVPHIRLPKSKYESYLKTLFDDAQVSNILGGTTILKMEDLVKKQFLVMSYSIQQIVESKGVSSLVSNKKIQKLLGTANPDVIDNFYTVMVKPMAEAMNLKEIASLDDLKRADIPQADQILDNLVIDADILRSNLDNYDFIQSMIGLVINGKETVMRQIAENANFMFLHRDFVDDFSEIGIHSINTYSPTTKKKVMDQIFNGEEFPDTLISDQVMDGILEAYRKGFTTEVLVNAKLENTGTDVITRMDLSPSKIGSILDEVKTSYPDLTQGDLELVRKFLDKEPNPRRIQIYEMKVYHTSNKRTLEHVYKKFFSRRDNYYSMLDGGKSFLDRTFYDYRSMVSQLNGVIGSKYFDYKQFKQIIDFEGYFNAKSITSINDKRDFVQRFLQNDMGEKLDLMLGDGKNLGLAGSQMKNLLESLIDSADPNDINILREIINRLSSFVDTHFYLSDVATVEEFLLTNRVFVVDYSKIHQSKDIATQVSQITIPVRFSSSEIEVGEIILEAGQSLFRSSPVPEGGTDLIFGFDLTDANGNLISPSNNPFAFDSLELANILSSEEFLTEMDKVEGMLGQRGITRFFSPQTGIREERNKIFEFTCEIREMETAEILNSLDEIVQHLPETAFNFLMHKLQNRLFGSGNDGIGMISRLTGDTFEVTKGIIGAGDVEFVKVLERIMDYKYLKSSTYNDLVISYREPRSFGALPVLKGNEVYHFAPLLDGEIKGQIMYDNFLLGVRRSSTEKSSFEFVSYLSENGNTANPNKMRKFLQKRDTLDFSNMCTISNM